MKVLYIAGYGRSGSSILSRLLGQQEGVFSLGEFGRIQTYMREDQACSCGQTVSRCEVWGPLTRQESGRLPSNGRLLDLIEGEGHAVAVDSSKTAYSDFLRPLFHMARGRPFYLVHVVRSPQSVLRSARKGRNKDLERGSARERPMETARTLLGWYFANAFATIYRLALGKRALLVRYEAFAADPIATLDRIERLIGHGLPQARGKIDNTIELDMGHEVAGNRLLRQGATVTPRNDQGTREPPGFWWRLFYGVARPFGGQDQG